MRMQIVSSLLAAVLATATAPARALDALDPVGTVNAFHGALQSGDEALAKSLLAPDVLIFESGDEERSRQEYAAHHLKADMQFMATVTVQVLSQQSGESGDLAWVSTRARFTGKNPARPLDLLSTETAVLRREGGAWRIRHVHWSSRSKAK